MEFCAATGNAGKLKEMRRILEKQGHTVKSQKELGITLEPEETGATFAENARIKAKAICEVCHIATIADDSGLAVDVLDGAPGVYSARYSGVHGDDEANNDKLLAALAGVPKDARGAKFVSAVCVYLPDGRSFTFMGECPGFVDTVRRGTNGFGYDPIFVPDAVGLAAGGWRENTEERSYAELADAEKDAISHRGNAMRMMEWQLPALLLPDLAAENSAAPKRYSPEIEELLKGLGKK